MNNLQTFFWDKSSMSVPTHGQTMENKARKNNK